VRPRSGPYSAPIAYCATALVSFACHGTALAQPRVHVLATTRFELRVQHQPKGAAIEGMLLDDTGGRLGGRTIDVALERDDRDTTRWRSIRTRRDGSFRTTLNLDSALGRARARFAGDADHAPSEVTQSFDLRQLSVVLRVLEPREARLDLDAIGQPIVVQAEVIDEGSSAGGEALEIAIADERGSALAQGVTGRDGVLRTDLQTALLGGPGMGRLVVSTRGDALRAAAQTELSVLRFVHSALRLQASIDRERGRVVIEGVLRARSGPLGERAIGLFDAEHHLATVWTDREGRFRHAGVRLPEAGTKPQTARLQARFDSDTVWLTSTRSQPISLRLVPEPAPSAWWFVATLSASGFGLWVLGRRAPRRFADPRATPPAWPGLVPAPTAQRGSRPSRTISGTVIDHERHHGIAQASLALEHSDGPRLAVHADSAGAFASPELAPGTWTLCATATDYGPLRETLQIPHRGEWSSCQVRLENLRSLALRAYKPIAIRSLPAAELWGRWTPRETLDHAIENRSAGEALAQLTLRVELATYASTPPTEQELAAIRRTAHELGALEAAPIAPESSQFGSDQSSAPRSPGRR
jgi:hypothetical protein